MLLLSDFVVYLQKLKNSNSRKIEILEKIKLEQSNNYNLINSKLWI